MGIQVCVVEGAVPDRLVICDLGPHLSPIIRAVKASLFPGRFDECVDPVWVTGRNSEVALSKKTVWKSAGQMDPGVSIISTPVDASFHSSADYSPGFPLCPPHGGVDSRWIIRSKLQVNSAGLIRNKKNILPGLASIFGPVDAPFRIWGKRIADGSDIHKVWIIRMDENGSRVSCFFQSETSPCPSRIRGFINTLSDNHIASESI